MFGSKGRGGGGGLKNWETMGKKIRGKNLGGVGKNYN